MIKIAVIFLGTCVGTTALYAVDNDPEAYKEVPRSSQEMRGQAQLGGAPTDHKSGSDHKSGNYHHDYHGYGHGYRYDQGRYRYDGYGHPGYRHLR